MGEGVSLTDSVRVLLRGVGNPAETVPARIIGPFALHRAIEDSDCWAVTHVYTGKGMRIRCKNAGKALAFIDYLNTHEPERWEFTTEAEFHQRKRALLALWRRACGAANIRLEDRSL